LAKRRFTALELLMIPFFMLCAVVDFRIPQRRPR
jgi:hypothetical protein